MKKIRIVLCTLFAAVIVAGAAAVSAFAELYIKSPAIPAEADKEAEEMWEESKLIIQFGMDDKSRAKALKLEKGFFVKGLGKSSSDYLYPITCNGDVFAIVVVSKTENGGLNSGLLNFDLGFNSLETSAGAPADIYVSDSIYFAVIGDEYFPIEDYCREKSSKAEINAAAEKIKEYRKESPSNGEYINVYGFAQNGWRTEGGNKYFIKRSGVLAKGWQTIGDGKYYFDKGCAAVTKDAVINGRRYRFGTDGKYLGTYTGFWESGGKQYYYKKGVKQTGGFTVDGKKYNTDKNGVII